MNANEPVAWAMKDKDGNFYDCISPEEHDRHEGSYTIPLYTHPAKTLTDEEIGEIYKEFFGFKPKDKYAVDFARAILKKASEK